LPLREPKYKSGMAVIKDYGGHAYKLSFYHKLRTKGVECDEPPPEKGSAHDEKLDQSISRTKAIIYEYAWCNPWDYFVTFTLDKEKYNRYDLEKYRKDLSRWIRNYSRKLQQGVQGGQRPPSSNQPPTPHPLKREAKSEGCSHAVLSPVNASQPNARSPTAPHRNSSPVNETPTVTTPQPTPAKNAPCIKYLLVPEQHEDGAWHIHGFIHGLPLEHLKAFSYADQPIPEYVLGKLAEGEPIYRWEAYADKFGFCTLEPVRNAEAAAKYVTKYITKDLSKCVKEINAHMYYCSKGLERAEVRKQGVMIERFEEIAEIAYENEYVRVAWLPHDEDTLKRLDKAVRSERELREEGAGHDLASGHRGIPDRPAGARKFVKDCPVLQAGARALCRIYRANPHSRLDPYSVQDLLYPPDDYGDFIDNDPDLHPGIEGIPDLVLS